MSDKLEQGIAVLTTFAAGETPSSAKLNSITAQLRNAAQQLEFAVGDVHDQSYPYSSATTARLSAAYGRSSEASPLANADTRRLDIVNLARIIGPASNLNPEMLAGVSRSIVENVPASVHEFTLEYVPDDISTISFTKNASGEPFEIVRPAESTLAASGEYHIDTDGRVYCTLITDAIAPGEVTYSTTPNDYHGGSNYLGAGFNVMPDPNQLTAGGSGCAIGGPDAQGRRAITLPVVTSAQMNVGRSSVTLTAADANYSSQLTLPLVITEAYLAGEVIPAGFILLKNWTTGEVYDSAEYTYNNSTSILFGVTNITTEVDRGDVFMIITIGTDLTTSVDDLRRKSRHAHDRSFGEPLVPASSISEWTAGPWGSRGSFTASAIEGNYAPQYLHRYGYTAGENSWNDYNIMRGDLVIGLSSGSPGAYLGSGSTFSLYFGDVSTAARLYRSGSKLVITNAGVLGMDITTTNSGSSILMDSAGDINLTADQDVKVSGGMNFIYNATDPFISSVQDIRNVGIMMNSSTGNVDMFYANIAAEGLMAGPNATSYSTSALNLWAIDENGEDPSVTSTSNGSAFWGYATTSNEGTPDSVAWKIPSFQVIHLAQQNVGFTPLGLAGAASPTWNNVKSWEASFNLPEYLYSKTTGNKGGNVVIGMSIMVKSAKTTNRWYTLGDGRYGYLGGGESISAYIDVSSASASGNKIKITIDALGDVSQAFNKTFYQGTDAGGDAATAASIDVKILLFVATPGFASQNILS